MSGEIKIFNHYEQQFDLQQFNLRFGIEKFLWEISSGQKLLIVTSSTGIKREAALNSGFSVLNLGELGIKSQVDGEERTQKQIYAQYGENGGVTPFRRSPNSPPVVLELAIDKAKDVIGHRQKFFEILNNLLPKKIQEFRKIHQNRFYSDEEIVQVLISTDPDVRSLFLILEKFQRFFTTDSAWGIYFPNNGKSIEGDNSEENVELFHKPKNKEEAINLLKLRVSQGAHLQSISGVIIVDYRYDPKTGKIIPYFRKKMVVVDYGEMDENLIEFINNSMEEKNGNALGLSSSDLAEYSEKFNLSDRKVRISLYDYSEKEGDSNYRISQEKNNNPSCEISEITFDAANYEKIIALSLGIPLWELR